MNIALEKCEEHVNGVKKRSYGDAFIRGNNGTFSTSRGIRSRHICLKMLCKAVVAYATRARD